jgi:hypothetical protein
VALGVDSASNRDEYQEYSFGGEGGRCVGLTTLPPSCANCLEILEPQSPGNFRPYLGLYRNFFAYIIVVFNTVFTTGTVQYILLVIYCTASVIFCTPEAAIFVSLYMCGSSILQCKQI